MCGRQAARPGARTCASGPWEKQLDAFLLVFRLVALVIVASWGRALLSARGKPADWTPRGFERWPPFRVTRDRYRVIAVLGVAAGLAVLAYSFLLASYLG